MAAIRSGVDGLALYGAIVATVAVLLAGASLGWQVYTHRAQPKMAATAARAVRRSDAEESALRDLRAAIPPALDMVRNTLTTLQSEGEEFSQWRFLEKSAVRLTGLREKWTEVEEHIRTEDTRAAYERLDLDHTVDELRRLAELRAKLPDQREKGEALLAGARASLETFQAKLGAWL